MTPRLLFDHFERLADAPDAIPKLRAMIFQLAVQGKLVPQNPDDEPASVLLEKISEEKKRLIEEGKIRKTEPLPPIGIDEVSYEVPKKWEWARLGTVTNYGSLSRIERDEVQPETWSLDLEDIEKITSRLLARVRHSDRQINSTRNIFQAGDVLYGKLRPYLDKVLVADEPGICTTEIIPFNGYGEIDSFYLRLVLKSPYFVAYATNSTHGMNLPRLATEKARLALLPIPPLTEQKRIVAKIEQLMALCDELEKRKCKGDEARVKLNAACLYELTSPEQKKARRAWNRIQSHFDLLYDTPANVAALRKSILQLAVMGKLVPQDPSDEPSSMLLKKTTAEKERLIEEGKIKRGKPLSPIRPDEVPYEVPKGWEWVRLGNLIKVTSGQALPRSRMVKGSIPVFGGNGITGYHNAANIDGHTVVIGRVGFYCGSVHETPEKAWITDNAFITAFPESYLFRPFVIWLLRATNLRQKDSATAQPVISGSKIYPLLVPLAPLAEQKRIVAKVDRLMALCDQLEARLAQSQRDCDAMLSAIVNQVESVS
jgi:type I restriction enzyme, S subunit